jgi:hypothetical protein
MINWIPVFVQIVVGAFAIWKMYQTHAWEAAEKTEKAVSSMAGEIGEIKSTLQTHIENDGENDARQARRRIISFSDECRRKVKHSEEHFDNVLEDITFYRQYCDTHPKFKNEKAEQSIAFVLEVSAACKRNNDYI